MVSVYSFFCSVIFFNVSLIGVFLLRRRTWFLARYAASSLMVLTVLGLARLFIPVDLDSAYVIRSEHIIPTIQKALTSKILGGRISIGAVLLLIWGCGTVVFAVRDLALCLKAHRARASYMYVENEQAARLAAEFGGKYIVKVSPDISVPHMAGLFHPVIYLPCMELSDEELRFILRHEIQHILSHDILKKFLFLAIEALFWWNPIAHISVNEIDALLELQCDAKITAGLDEEGVLDYVQAILSVMKQTYSTRSAGEAYSFAVAKDSPQLRQRFEVLFRRNHRRSKAVRVLLNCVFLALFILSYMVIIQPYYPSPEDVQGKYDFINYNSYIRHMDGQYILYYNDMALMELPEAEITSAPFNKLEILEE